MRSSGIQGQKVKSSGNGNAELFANLPPLPPGIGVEQLAQFGGAGLEMAIRMGMGIGMGLGQTAMAQGKMPEIDPVLVQQQLFALVHEVSKSSSQMPSPIMTRVTTTPSPGTPSAGIVSDILNDDFFSAVRNPTPPGGTPALPGRSFISHSRRTSQSGEPLIMSPIVGSPANSTMALPGEPTTAAKIDPLATQVWKAYAKAKGHMPNGPRMENLTWRLMHMTLKKSDSIAGVTGTSMIPIVEEGHEEEQVDVNVPTLTFVAGEETERGRGRSAKGKAKVVGFDAESPQGNANQE